MGPYYVWNSDVSVLYATCTRKGFLSPLFLFPAWCLQDTSPAPAPWAEAPDCPEPSEQMEPAQLWASLHKLPTLLHFTCSREGLCRKPRAHRIRNWHFLMRTMWVSWSHHVFYSPPKAWLPGLRNLPGLTELKQAGAHWGCFLRTQTQPRQPWSRPRLRLCPMPPAPAPASLLLTFLRWEVWHTQELPLLLGVWPKS